MLDLKIKDFGPIIRGYRNSKTDDFFCLQRCVIFIGEQGTGKSTIAKLLSTLLWLEKDIIQRKRDYTRFTTEDFFTLCENQKIDDYFSENTYFCFRSDSLQFEYKTSKFSIDVIGDFSKYVGKKIMYIPSERNLISVLDDVEGITGLPYTLQSTYEEFTKANKNLGEHKKRLPLNGFEYSYEKNSNSGFVKDRDNGSVVKLSVSSSGLQSFIPLCLISDNLSKNVTKDFFDRIRRLSSKEKDIAKQLLKKYSEEHDDAEQNDIMNKFERLVSTGLNSELTELDKKVLMTQLKSIINVAFANIVEEPEQNLYPSAQIEVARFLIHCMNENERNSLVITTHSPFILSTLNNLLYGTKIHSKQIDQMSNLYAEQCSAYLCKDGEIIDILDKDNGIIDTTVIDDCATILNQQFDDLYNEEITHE